MIVPLRLICLNPYRSPGLMRPSSTIFFAFGAVDFQGAVFVRAESQNYPAVSQSDRCCRAIEAQARPTANPVDGAKHDGCLPPSLRLDSARTLVVDSDKSLDLVGRPAGRNGGRSGWVSEASRKGVTAVHRRAGRSVTGFVKGP